MRPADAAWVSLAIGVIAYDVACPAGQMLSEGVDRYLDCRPWVTRTVIAVVALHLANVLPSRFDPFHQLAVVLRR